jgi:sporulation protein YlmC with PRC-barrel domain
MFYTRAKSKSISERKNDFDSRKGLNQNFPDEEWLEFYPLSEQDLVKSEGIIGKTVVNMRAEKLGEVKDIAYHASGKKALIISSPEGIDKIYSFDQAVAIKDVILLDENKTSTTSGTLVPPANQVPSGPVPAPLNQSPPIPRFTTPVANLTSMATKMCPFCQRQNRLQSKFCVQCGKLL